MSELQIIESALQQAARRRRWARALRGLWRGLLVGAVLSLVVVGAWHLLPLPLWTLTAAALAPFPCALAGMIIGGWRKTALPEVARWVDGRQHLQERLSTALEVAGGPGRRDVARPGGHRCRRTCPRSWTRAGWCRSACPGRRAGRWWSWRWGPGWALCPNTAARASCKRRPMSRTSRRSAGSSRT